MYSKFVARITIVIMLILASVGVVVFIQSRFVTVADKDDLSPMDSTTAVMNTSRQSTSTTETESFSFSETTTAVTTSVFQTDGEHILTRYQSQSPKTWGENVAGVITHIETDDKVIALTFDACGSRKTGGYDAALIDFLRSERIPATLFISGQWIDKHPETFLELAGDPLFEIGNHGYRHRPLSISGQRAYGIKGTATIKDAYDEVVLNQNYIQSLTGAYPQYYRSGTAYYDDVAVAMVSDMDIKTINYSLLGDAGATFSKAQIIQSLKRASAGDIALFHMNHPEKPIAEGVEIGVRYLREQGYQFVKLSDYHNQLK